MSPEQFMREHNMHIRKIKAEVMGSAWAFPRTQYTYEVYKPGMKRGTGYTTYFSPAPSMDVSTPQALTAVARELICIWMAHVCDATYWHERDGRDDDYSDDPDYNAEIAEGRQIRKLFGPDVFQQLYDGYVDTE